MRRPEALGTTRIGAYVLGRCIGEGGNAAVYVARHTTPLGTSRLVALKLVDTSKRDWSIDQFRREALLATRLEHPGIVRTYDVGEHDGRMYIAMELILGATLDRAPGPLSIPLFLRVVSDVGRALDYAHDLRGEGGAPLGIVHQDVSPQNVMVGYDGRVHLLDFGVARLVAHDASRTDTIRGKPAYLSPEQLEGERIDRRTDVFALGAVAYELLTGKPLFARDTIAATYRAVLLEPVPALTDVRADVPPALASVVARALRRDPDTRFQSAAELVGALEEAMNRVGVAPADDDAMCAWVRAGAPPTVTHAELEAEILDAPPPAVFGVSPSTEGKETVAIPRAELLAEKEAIAPVRSPRRVALLGAIAASIVAVAIAIAAEFAGRTRAPSASPMPDASIVAAASASAPLLAASDPPATSFTIPPVVSASASANVPKVARRPGVPARPVPSAPLPPAAPAMSVAAAQEAPAAPKPGYLSVWSNVWGHVEVDGRPVGDSPLTHLPIPAGRHELRVHNANGEQTRARVIAPGEEAYERFVF